MCSFYLLRHIGVTMRNVSTETMRGFVSVETLACEFDLKITPTNQIARTTKTVKFLYFLAEFVKYSIPVETH